AIAPVAVTLDDLEEEAFCKCAAVELEILAMLVAVIEDICRLQPFRQGRIEAEAGLDIAVIVRRDRQWPEAVRRQRLRGLKNVVRAEGQVLDARAELLG